MLLNDSEKYETLRHVNKAKVNNQLDELLRIKDLYDLDYTVVKKIFTNFLECLYSLSKGNEDNEELNKLYIDSINEINNLIRKIVHESEVIFIIYLINTLYSIAYLERKDLIEITLFVFNELETYASKYEHLGSLFKLKNVFAESMGNQLID